MGWCTWTMEWIVQPLYPSPIAFHSWMSIVVVQLGFRTRPLRDGGGKPSPGRLVPPLRRSTGITSVGQKIIDITSELNQAVQMSISCGEKNHPFSDEILKRIRQCLGATSEDGVAGPTPTGRRNYDSAAPSMTVALEGPMPTSSRTAQRRQRHPRWWIVSMASTGSRGCCRLWHMGRLPVALTPCQKGVCGTGPRKILPLCFSRQVFRRPTGESRFSNLDGSTKWHRLINNGSAVLG